MAGEGLRSKSELTQRVISAVILAVLAIFAAWYGGVPFALIWIGLAVAVAFEWGRIVDPPRAPLLGAAVGLALIVAFAMIDSPQWSIFALVDCAVVGAVIATANRGWTAAGAIYAFVLGMATIVLRGKGADGFVAILFLFAAVWLTDIGAYFAGRTFGGPKFAPAISPKKTWSGVIGGLLSGVAGSMIVLAVAGYPLRGAHVLIALVLAMAVVLGDLIESFIKRRFGVKDAGSLIPGHGGFMDRLDGFVIAAALAAAIGVTRGGWGDAAGGLLR